MNQEKIGKFILKLRKENNMTQQELADKLNVTDRAVSHWENGRSLPDLSLFSKLCEILDITINDLMSGEKVDDKEYIKNLEKNMVSLADSLKQKRKKQIKISILIIIILLLGFFMYNYYYNSYEEPVTFDNYMMMCNIYNKELTFSIRGTSILNEHHVVKNIDGKDIYIFNYTLLRKNKDFYAWELKQGVSRLANDNYWLQASHHNFTLKNENVEVYYTELPLSKFDKATENEIRELLTKSHKMNCWNEADYIDKIMRGKIMNLNLANMK